MSCPFFVGSKKHYGNKSKSDLTGALIIINPEMQGTNTNYSNLFRPRKSDLFPQRIAIVEYPHTNLTNTVSRAIHLIFGYRINIILSPFPVAIWHINNLKF
ncbi:hypothetical protein B6J44_11155 [Klebsiella pneumoniae]|nr:hypothetical protein B6J44_11155 [Klebsiella pneumoniae]